MTAAETWPRRGEALAVLPAFVRWAGGVRAAARYMRVPERYVHAWLGASRTFLLGLTWRPAANRAEWREAPPSVPRPDFARGMLLGWAARARTGGV